MYEIEIEEIRGRNRHNTDSIWADQRKKSELPSWVSGASETGPALGFLKLGLKEVRRSGWPSSCRRYSQGKFDIFWGGMELSSNKISV